MVLSGITITLLARRWVTGCCTKPFAKWGNVAELTTQDFSTTTPSK